MESSSSSSRSEGGLSKWQVAVLVGVPVAAVAVAGVFVYLWRRSRTRAAQETDGTNVRPPVENHPIGTGGTDEEVVTPTTPEIEESKVTY